jgi:hypothetical protein
MEMTVWKRAMWGVLGALLPFAIKVAGQQHVYEDLTALRISGFIDHLVPALILLAAGGVVAAVFDDEVSPKKLLVLGMSAPALIASWSGYSLAESTADQTRNLLQLQRDAAKAGESVQRQQRTTDSEGRMGFFQLIPTVHAAGSAVATFAHADLSGLEKLRAAVGGALPNRDYFVIAGSYPSLPQAQKEQAAAKLRFTGRSVELYAAPDGYAPPLYSVVVSPNLAFDDATTLLKGVAEAGYKSSYIWTFGLPLRPAQPPVLSLRSIYVKHDGSPRSTKWRFDIFVNGSQIAAMPEHQFGSEDREVPVNQGDDLVFKPVSLPPGNTWDIEVRGYREGHPKPVTGVNHLTIYGGTSANFDVEVRDAPSFGLLGLFQFRFRTD